MKKQKIGPSKPKKIKKNDADGPSEEEIRRCLSDVDHFLPAAEEYYGLIYEEGDEMRKVIPFGTAFYLWAAEYRACGCPYGEGSVGLRKWFEHKSRMVRTKYMTFKKEGSNDSKND